MPSNRPQPAVSVAARPPSTARRVHGDPAAPASPGSALRRRDAGCSGSRSASSMLIGRPAALVQDTVPDQPDTRVLGVLLEPGRRAAEAEAVAPFVHVLAHSLAADAGHGIREDDLQVADRPRG